MSSSIRISLCHFIIFVCGGANKFSHTHFVIIVTKGSGANMLKVNTVRRRTKQEVKAEKEEKEKLAITTQ